MLQIGTQAPTFTLEDQNGTKHSLSDFLGQKVVIYFYPKDNTPGCTRQACSYANLYSAFQAKNCVVIGISKDSVSSHANFANKYTLPFILLANPDTTVLQAYEVWQERKNYGKTYMGVVRSTYLIDENGVIIYAKEKVDPDEDAEKLLKLV